jgi:hypothetical protein
LKRTGVNHGKEIFPILRKKYPQAYFQGIGSLARIIRRDVDPTGASDREHLVIDDGNIDNLCRANAGRVLGYRVQHRLNVIRRIGDYAEDITDRRLLLQRLVPFADDPRELGFMSTSR